MLPPPPRRSGSSTGSCSRRQTSCGGCSRSTRSRGAAPRRSPALKPRRRLPSASAAMRWSRQWRAFIATSSGRSAASSSSASASSAPKRPRRVVAGRSTWRPYRSSIPARCGRLASPARGWRFSRSPAKSTRCSSLTKWPTLWSPRAQWTCTRRRCGTRPRSISRKRTCACPAGATLAPRRSSPCGCPFFRTVPWARSATSCSSR
mmetsp:Transcript_66808/g.186680  ORF Transcript_66808/g.186680 Transcript_66808/m.186680 type:complete len:205 (+) Transcript_66808:123-737(+)